MKRAGAFRFLVGWAFVLGSLLWTSRAQGNLVVNGGFESLSGGAAGWEGQYGMIQPHTLPAYFVKEGRVVGAVVDVRGIGNQPMLQRLSTEPSIPYVLEFSLLSGQGNLGGQDPPLPVTVRWGSQTLGDFSNPSTTEWQTFQLNVAAESRVTELSFMTLGTTWQLIDEISVTAVPEPTPVNLAITALAAMAMFRTYTFVISANGRKG